MPSFVAKLFRRKTADGRAGGVGADSPAIKNKVKGRNKKQSCRSGRRSRTCDLLVQSDATSDGTHNQAPSLLGVGRGKKEEQSPIRTTPMAHNTNNTRAWTPSLSNSSNPFPTKKRMSPAAGGSERKWARDGHTRISNSAHFSSEREAKDGISMNKQTGENVPSSAAPGFNGLKTKEGVPATNDPSLLAADFPDQKPLTTAEEDKKVTLFPQTTVAIQQVQKARSGTLTEANKGETLQKREHRSTRARASHISVLVVAVIHLSYVLFPTLLLSPRSFGIFLTGSAVLAVCARPIHRNTDHQPYMLLRVLLELTGGSKLSKLVFVGMWLSKFLGIVDGKQLFLSLQLHEDKSKPLDHLRSYSTLQRILLFIQQTLLSFVGILVAAWNTFSGPQLYVNVLVDLATRYSSPLSNRTTTSAITINTFFGIPVSRPSFRERIEDTSQPAPIEYWFYCLAKTPISATFKFLTQVTCPRYFAEDDLLHSSCDREEKLDGPFHGTVYSFLPQSPPSSSPQSTTKQVVEELRNVFKEELYPNMRATYMCSKHELPYMIEYLEVEQRSGGTSVTVSQRITTEDPEYDTHLKRLELTRYLHDFAGIHLLVHIWYEDYTFQTETHLHPSDPLLIHFQSLATATGYLASVGPFSFDPDYNKIGEYFGMKDAYLEGFDMNKCGHFNADVVRFVQNNHNHQMDIESCRVTMLYAKSFQLWAANLVRQANQQINEQEPTTIKAAVQTGRLKVLQALNDLHDTHFATMEELITNQLLLAVQHSLLHTTSYRRQSYVDDGKLAASFPPVHTYVFTMEQVMKDLPFKEELKATFLPPKDVEYGIQE